MKYLIVALLLICGSAQAGWNGCNDGWCSQRTASLAAMVTPVFIDTNNSGPNNAATNYIGFNGGSFNATQVNRESVIAISGTVGNLRVNFPTAVSAGTTYDICLVKNGSATCLSPSCQIRNTATNCIDIVNTASVVAGDFLAWKVVPTGTPAAQTVVQMSATITASGTAPDSVLSTPFRVASSNTTTTQYTMLGSSNLWDNTESNLAEVVPTAGVIDSLWVSSGGNAPGAAKSVVYTLMKNGVATALTCTLSGTGTGSGVTFCNDASHTVSVVATDTVSIQAAPTGTPSTGFQSFSARWTPTTRGEAFIPAAFGGLSTGSIQYFTFGPSISLTEANALSIAPVPFTLKKLYVSTTSAPGGSANRVIINRKGTGGGQSNGSVTCTVGSAATTCNDTSNVSSISANDFVNWMETPNTTPVSPTYFKYSVVMATQ